MFQTTKNNMLYFNKNIMENLLITQVQECIVFVD